VFNIKTKLCSYQAIGFRCFLSSRVFNVWKIRCCARYI